MKKIIAMLVSVVLALGMVACGTSEQGESTGLKLGLICLHDEQSTYDANFIEGFKNACNSMSCTYVIKTNISEGEDCYVAACELADEGCNIIFGDSFGHEPYLLQAAQEYPTVEFCHATGTLAHTSGTPNFHNAFAAIYEGRYLAGVAAGLKLNEMYSEGKITTDQLQIGYVGAFPYAEVISGFTAFYLGAKSVCPLVTMEVTYTNSWYDEAAEREAAKLLINNGAVLISQHADSFGSPSMCEELGVPNVSYNGSTKSVGPNSYIISSRINWEPYFVYLINCVNNGKEIDLDWVGTIANKSVELTELNTGVAAEGTADFIERIKSQIISGEIKVFDTDNFTVKGEHLTSYKADVDTDEGFTPDTEAITGGYFHESEYRSAPYFDIIIDGITIR